MSKHDVRVVVVILVILGALYGLVVLISCLQRAARFFRDKRAQRRARATDG